MSRSRFLSPMIAWSIVAVSAATLLAAPPAKSSNEAARFDVYSQPEGDSYFALSLMPQVTLPTVESSEIVVLFDTSATQVGPYRDKGMEALRGLLATLGDNDRVKLMAVDVKAVPMSSGFVAPRGPEMQAAMQKLMNRAPLGATDLEAALQSAVSEGGNKSAAKAAIYIGDGQSNANLMEVDVVGLIDRLVKNRISVNSFAVGPAKNAPVLAALANQTGGVVLFDADNIAGPEAGAKLARASHEPIVWPTERKMADGLAEVYPDRTPPLRSDRDTVLIGKGKADDAFQVEIVGESSGKPVKLSWNVAPAKSSDDNSYLVQLVDFAKADRGYSLPTIGSEGLWEARNAIHQGAHNLTKLGRQAAASGDTKNAKQFIAEAVRRDPNNPNALVMHRALQDGNLQDSEVRPAQAQVETPDAVLPAAPGEGDLLNSIEQRQRVVAQKVITETIVELNRARDRLPIDPAGVQQDMKLLLDRVMQVAELSSEQRSDLRDRISTMLQEAAQRREVKEVADVERERNLAAARERERLLSDLTRKEDRISILVGQFNGLIDEGYRNYDMVDNPYFKQATDDPGAEIARVTANPYGRQDTIGTTAREFALLAGYHSENMAVREAAQRGFMASLHSTDVAHIPTPDVPPIIYPDPEFWRTLTERREKYNSVDLASTGDAEARILKALDEKTEMEFTETPLNLVLDYIKDRHKIEVQPDAQALRDAAIDLSTTPITRNLRGITLRSALKLLLADLNLTYVIKNEVLLVTTTDKATNTLVTKVYPVADLVIPIQTNQVNPFQLGGGLGGGGGGGFGGGGGGFGGGGLGGGGGFGGGGLGGGGLGGGGFGGGFNVADEIDVPLPAKADGGPLSVEDSLNLSGKKKPADDAAPVVKQPSAPTVLDENSLDLNDSKPDPIVVKTDVDPSKFWDDYFANLPLPDEKQVAEIVRKRDAALREVAKELMNARKFNHVTAMIQASLRHGFARPWMYEALALAMRADDQPQEEIERALMSAVDFAHTPSDLMHIAVYMSRIGLDARALKLMRQASAMEPYRHEPYMIGLKIADRLGDEDGIRWACLGVLGQAWPDEKAEVVESARYAASALLDNLRKNGKSTEANEFRSELDKVLQRDCIVKVTWTGDADIDATIEDPSGSVCSAANPRSPGGGVLLGDVYSRANQHSNDGFSETYIVPHGFSGQYKLLLRRVWGQVATGKVTVDIITHSGTPRMRHLRKQIPVGERDAVVSFDLDDGRRTEPLDQVQLANAAKQQLDVSRAVLAQQLAAIETPSTGPNGGVNPPRPIVGGPQGNRFLPFGARGAVGYQPVIQTLPEGTNMSATAVISADRRYVRISATPFFSTVGPVNTFNFATGEEGTSNNNNNNN